MDLRATTKIRNNVMIAKREKLGMNQTKFANLCGITLNDVFQFEKLNFKINNAEDKAIKISLVCGVDVERIMPEALIDKTVQTTISQVKEVNPTRLLDLSKQFQARSISASPEDILMEVERNEALEESLSSLTHRERTIIEMRYGLNGQKESTLDEVSKVFKVTRQRIRELQERAIRRLQHPIRATPIQDTWEEVGK